MTGELNILKGAAKETPRGALMLRRHKMLPHPIRQLDLKLNTYQLPSDYAEVCSSEELSSKKVYYAQKETGAPELPPTPPTITRPPSENDLLISSHFNFDQNSTVRLNKPPSLNTLRSGQSPPTPDFTPPRQSRSTFVSLTQNPYPSSNSFLTAPEDPYISDEDESGYAMMTLLLSTGSSESHLKLSDAEQLQDAYEHNLEEYSEEAGIRPKIWYTESLPKTNEILDDQSLEASRDIQNSTFKDHSLSRGSTVRQCKSRQSTSVHYFANEATETTTGAKFYLSFRPSDPSLPYYYKKAFSQKLSAEQEYDKVDEVEESRDSNPISSDFSMHSEQSPIRSTHESTTSWTSAYNRPPTNAKTLRHTRKRIGLRDGIGQPSQLPLVVSNNDFYESEPNRNRSKFKAPELVNPTPASNNTSPRLSSEYRKEIIKKGGIPVLVIPERTSCGKSHRTISLRSTSSRKTRRSISPNIMPVSYHNRFYDNEKFDLNLWKSDLLSSFPDPGYSESINRPTSSTSIRDSTSTTQSSTCTSRPSSLTTESLRTHNQLLGMNSFPKSDLDFYPASSATSSKISSENSGRVSGSFHNRLTQNHVLSGYITPYSQSSYETAAEVSEALAVSLFPLQTRSIMVRQNRTSLGSFAHPTTLSPEFKTNSKLLDTGQRKTPPTALEIPSYSDSDIDSEIKTESLISNLKNPSEPPVILFHPPTPRTADHDSLPASECLISKSDSLNKQISISSFPASPSYDFEDFSPITSTISNGARPAYLDRISSDLLNEDDISFGISCISDVVPDQSKLHPFWRPTKFWNDNEDFNENFDHKEVPNQRRKIFSRGTISSRLIKGIRVFPLQKSRESSIKSTEYQQVTRISENPRVMKNHRIKYNRGDVRLDAEDKYWGLDFKEGNGGRMHSFPGLGLRIENKGWNELKRWAKEKKKEKKLESQISTSNCQPLKKLDNPY
ncbi:hypothetical protein EPUL_003273 [Erysiphe pulchra]|uniref:Uncharacterized protein n=1 Tax=Erysiphe pulchra TaxID=225359 RepID=A0A2S4PXQ1_9PEZI|nr:hypothetical protein EPUL_003273 [Erysiphe pulchra]